MRTQQDTTDTTLNLEQLGEHYEVIGELAGREDARTFIGRRRADGADVVIAVVEKPQGDEGNALSHLAADIQLLAAHPHPNVIALVDGQWVGTDAFAVVSERVPDPTIEELLSRRDEEFPYPRIAGILQSVNRVLEWARAKKVVHRAVALDTLFLESGSDRVRVAFAVRPLPRAVMPGAEDDARTIASLARAMLTRSAADPERANRPLAELRPGLPVAVIEQTDALLQLSRTSPKVPDISGYIAAIAMAQALKDGEIHLDKTRHLIEEQQRLHREQLEKERRDHDEQLALEHKTHEQEVAEQAKRFQKEREEFEQKLAREQKALEKEQEALAKERAAHAKDCAALMKEREAHERDVEEMRQKLEWESAALATQAERYAAQSELETDLVLPDREDRPRRPAFVPPVVPVRAMSSKPARSSGSARRHRPHWNSKWNVPAAAAALVVLIGLSVLAISGVGRTRSTASSTQAPALVVDSIAGVVTVPVETLHAVTDTLPSAPPLPAAAGVPADLVAGVVARADSAPVWVPVRRDPPVRREPTPAPQRMESWSVTQPPGAGTTVRIDTIIGSSVRVDSVRRGGTTIRSRPDSLPRRDSTSRDTLERRDFPRH